MHITPKQRRRSTRVHYLRQRGQSLKKIAETVNVSVATVRSDLKLVETHWSSIASAAADDLLLESLFLLKTRLSIAVAHDHVADNISRLTPTEYLRARDAQETQLNGLAREIRRTAHEVQRRAEQRPDQPDLFEEQPQELAGTTPKLSKIEPPDPTIPSPEQETVQSETKTEKIPTEPDLDALIAEAVQHFPRLQGQSPEQILHFLDQITTPEAQDKDTPTPIYAEAAG